MARALLLAYGLVAYAVGVVAFACLVGFVGNFGVRGIDEGPQLGVVAALVRDLGLCALFGLQHSLMARERFKRRVTTLAPSAAERSTFVLAASACTFALILGWAPLPQVLWRADGLLAAALTGLSALGWLLNLGEVAESARVRLNGNEIGALIGPVYEVYLSPELFREDNLLEVEVTNLMANRIADMDKRGVLWKKFYNVNFPARRRENRGENGLFDASGWEPRPSGLLGPVTLTKVDVSGQ